MLTIAQPSIWTRIQNPQTASSLLELLIALLHRDIAAHRVNIAYAQPTQKSNRTDHDLYPPKCRG